MKYLSHVKMAVVVFLLAFLPIAKSWGNTEVGKRVALVVGIGDYSNTAPLANPTRDATGIATSLKSLGFDVTLRLDLNQNNFGRTLTEFEEKLDGAETALFYFAGHGIQVSGENYLLTKQAKVESPHLIDSDGMKLSRILNLMQRKAKVNIALIDACRDNPLANNLLNKLGSDSRSFGLTRGLASVKNAYDNSLVAFATAPGSVALDGNQQSNSPFTSALLKHLDARDVEISTMLKRVTRDVLNDTEGKQKPEVVSSMFDEFYFAKTEINISGNLTIQVPAIESEEALATRLLDVARTMPAGMRRIESLQLVQQKYPQTAAATFAASLIEQQVERYKIAPEKLKAESFDRTKISALDVDKAISEARKNAVKIVTPEEIEIALGLEQEDTIRIQTALNAMGYDLGTADGAFGPKSREALKEFQRTNRVKDTGYLSSATINSIISKFQEAPKSYDGKWVLSIYRKWRKQDRGQATNTAGSTELLATLDLDNQNGTFYVDSYDIYTLKPTEPFSGFKASVSDSGNFNVQTDVSYLFGGGDASLRVGRLKGSVNLPRLMPFGKEVSADANVADEYLRFQIRLYRKRK